MVSAVYRGKSRNICINKERESLCKLNLVAVQFQVFIIKIMEDPIHSANSNNWYISTSVVLGQKNFRICYPLFADLWVFGNRVLFSKILKAQKSPSFAFRTILHQYSYSGLKRRESKSRTLHLVFYY